MPLPATGPVVIGTHAEFFRDGTSFTVPSAGTAGRTSKPGAADTGWISLGVIAEASIEAPSESVEVWAPNPGKRVLHDVLETKGQLNVRLTLQELSPIAFELLMRSGPLTQASATFEPLAALQKKGWLKLRLYDHGDTQITEAFFYVSMKVNGETNLGDGLANIQVEARVLNSTVDGGSCGAPA